MQSFGACGKMRAHKAVSCFFVLLFAEFFFCDESRNVGTAVQEGVRDGGGEHRNRGYGGIAE